MLNVFFGSMPEAIYNTSVYFNNSYMDSWLTEDFSKQIIKAIDHAKVLSSNAVDSNILGIIPVTSLSGGVKTLLLIDHLPQMVFNASTCGDNCAKWLLKLAEKRRVVVNLRHLMDFGDEPFKLRVLNNNRIVRSMGELIEAAGEYV